MLSLDSGTRLRRPLKIRKKRNQRKEETSGDMMMKMISLMMKTRMISSRKKMKMISRMKKKNHSGLLDISTREENITEFPEKKSGSKSFSPTQKRKEER